MSRRNKKQTRPRGGASHPCPACGGDSRVLLTRRLPVDTSGTPPGSVSRKRECLSCGTQFSTNETIAED